MDKYSQTFNFANLTISLHFTRQITTEIHKQVYAIEIEMYKLFLFINQLINYNVLNSSFVCKILTLSLLRSFVWNNQ